MYTVHEVRVICMDCKVVIHEGDPKIPDSHGLCPSCFQKRIIELDQFQRAGVR